MGSSLRRVRPINAEIQASTSSPNLAGEIAIASPALWKALDNALDSQDPHTAISLANGDAVHRQIGIAVEFPEDRRIDKRNVPRNLVIWFERTRDVDDSDRVTLYLPPQLIPQFGPTPLFGKVHLHRPVELSLVVLRPVVSPDYMSDSAILNLDDLDIASEDQNRRRICRQGERTMVSRRSGSSQAVKVVLVEPVDQGMITSKTKIIIATEPLVDEVPFAPDHASQSSSHLSLADFDPDAFLASSLDMHLSRTLPDGATDDLDSTYTSTEGTITPGRGALTPPSPPVEPEQLAHEDDERNARFTAVQALGPSSSSSKGDDVDVCWMGLGGLGRSGIFENDWVLIKTVKADDPGAAPGRLVRAVAWEKLDEDDPNLPGNPLLLPPLLYRALFADGAPSHSSEVVVVPTTFGARRPTLPLAKTITLARVATAEGIDKRYERSWLKGLKTAFEGNRDRAADGEGRSTLVRRGDVFSVPIWKDRPLDLNHAPADDDTGEDLDSDDNFDSSKSNRPPPTTLAYFIITGLSYEPLVPLEEDFGASTSSKARAGELGCWADVGAEGSTKMVLNGIERTRIGKRSGDQTWHGLRMSPKPFDGTLTLRLRDLMSSAISAAARSTPLSLSLLVSGARGGGKTTMVTSVADGQGYNIITIEGYDLAGDTNTRIEGTLQSALDKAASCSPSILLIRHIEALAQKTESSVMGRQPPIVRILQEMRAKMQAISLETGFPCILVATCVDADDLPGEVSACFKQNLMVQAPNVSQRTTLFETVLHSQRISPDVLISHLAAQSASLLPADIQALVLHAEDLATQRAETATDRMRPDLDHAGISIASADFDMALGDARTSHADSIGAPKIPNVQWDDIGGLAHIKKEILETVQLPLDHPELFADGLKKRSGILLYGPPGTGKTLLAKAVATTCNLNFFSVKGPELLNMYIGESEANVRRVFQKARDASPCIIFMDELDSIAPKRGNQGDSGGVMDRIVSQLLAELDGMSSGSKGEQVFVMGATNRPDLLDPALLRPGRFDRMLYLSMPTTHEAQTSILRALTRKFRLDPNLDIEEIAEMCPFNYTGADFYALCSDAMLRAMSRKATEVDDLVESLNRSGSLPKGAPKPLTVQYYLANMETKLDTEVVVSKDDFVHALSGLVPSVSDAEVEHYERVQRDFKGYSLVQNGDA